MDNGNNYFSLNTSLFTNILMIRKISIFFIGKTNMVAVLLGDVNSRFFPLGIVSDRANTVHTIGQCFFLYILYIGQSNMVRSTRASFGQCK